MSEFKSIKFSQNWNRKIDNLIFTTIRKKDYHVNQGDKVCIVLNDKLYKWCIAELVIKTTVSSVGPFLLMLDTGLLYDEAIKQMKAMGIDFNNENTEITFLLLRTIVNPATDTKIQYASTGQHQEILKFD